MEVKGGSPEEVRMRGELKDKEELAGKRREGEHSRQREEHMADAVVCLRGLKILSVARGLTHKRMRTAEGEGANPENPANWSQKPWAECFSAERLPRG